MGSMTRRTTMGWWSWGPRTRHQTFAVACIRRWWLMSGREALSWRGQRLLIQADAGGANDYRKWEWKVALQKLADEFDLVITVTHYPPGASKWNPIDHRMFSLISGNWAGEPLVSYEKDAQAHTPDAVAGGVPLSGLPGRQGIPTEVARSAPQTKARIRLQRRKVLPEWNYSIFPHRHHPDC